ncbi:MAG: FKBP-type peptidyl-prolyl cis-trans isomerase, partial [Synechococcaceae bacterium WB9_2_112]|nr:FKBP-type peptidyl-prolyl cis-trans isomerase [Synechococcaceae bacterium WB9_2_112]
VDASSTTSEQTLLLGLNALNSAPIVEWSSLLPDEQISRLWRIASPASPSSLVTVGSSLTGAGAITTRYTLTASGPALTGASRTFLAGPNDQQARAADAVVLTPAATNQPALVQVGLATTTTTTGLVPNGGTDVLVSALDAAGNLLWERLFGNSSVELQPRLAATADGSVVVAATMQGSLGLNPGAGRQDIGLASYGPDGSLRWRRLLGDAGDQSITDLTVAADGTVLVLGLSSGSSGLYGQPLRGDGTDLDSFLTAYSPQGDRLWTVQFGSPGDDLALAMAWMPRADSSGSSVNTLVVVGSQATAAAPDEPKAWVELLELQPTTAVAPSLIPPTPPTLDWTLGSDTVLALPLAVVRATAGSGPQLTLQGSSEPGSTVLVRTSLGSAVSTTSADATTGRWTLAITLPQLTADQLGQGFVVVQARDTQGLLSDSTTAPVLFTGNGLPGELPQVLAIDPDGASGSQAPALLKRQLTAVGDGPLTTAGQRLLVDYSGTLTNGTPFDSSLKAGRRPFDLTLGTGQVITGWDQGLQGLPLGSQVRLVIPPSLAYGDRATGSIPASSTLVFDVDLRADLSIPELFLSQVVWPQLFAGTTYSQTNASAQTATGLDLLGLALNLGPGDGSANADTLTVSPANGLPTTYPLLAMGGAGNDSLSAINLQSNLLFGESGNDQLSSASTAYAFLDGGPGDDRFETAALISWLRGGSGIDSVNLSNGDWRLLRRGTVAGDPWLELGRFDVAGSAGKLQQIVQLQGVEQLQGVGRLTLSAPSSTTGLEANAADLQGLLDSLGPAAVLDAKAVTALSGSAAAVRALLTSSRLEKAANLAITLTDTTVAAADLNTLNGSTTGVVNAASVTTITGALA